MKKYKSLLIFAVLTLTAILWPTSLFAQSQPISSGIATMIEMKDSVTEGDIISFTTDGYKRSNIEYDPHVFGIVTENPQVVLEQLSSKNAHPVISVGKVYVRVSSANGNIKAGDLITTSEIPGVGQRAQESGYVIGTALDSYSSNNPKAVGKVLVVLNISFNTRPTTVSSNLIQSLKLALSAPEVSPVNALRYALAVGIVLLAFIFAIAFFGRVSSRGVEAIGRNPLASRAIMLSMVFHLSLALVIIFVGIAIAYLILIL